MAVMLPDGLIWIMEKLGFDWPDLDEDEIRRGADMVRQFTADLTDIIDAVDRRMAINVTEASTSQGALSFVDGWNQTRSANLQKILDVGGPAATGVDVFADAVMALKIKVVADVTLTAAQVAAALASSFVTFGAGAAVAAGLIMARKVALGVAMDIALEQLLAQVLPMVIEPLAEQMPAVVSALLDSPVVTGPVGDLAEMKNDVAALEQASEDLEMASTDIETLTSQFIEGITSLNISGS